MADKVITAVFGKDLRVKIEKRELNDKGNRISFVPSGEGYFMPEIGPTTFLDLPSWKKYILFGARTYKRVFFVEKGGARCVDFGLGGTVYGPDTEALKRSNLRLLAEKIGQNPEIKIPWYFVALLLINTAFLFVIARVLGVF